MKPSHLLALACLLPLGCDFEQLFADAEQAAEKKAAAEKASSENKAGETKQAGAVDPATDHLPGPVAECVAACDADTTLSATDRATCRLNCEQMGTVAATAGETALRDFAVCSDGCDAKTKTDAETCRLNCATMAATALAAQSPSGSDEFRTCTSTCLEDMSACRTGCGPGDATATCRLQCESEGQHCVGTCRD